MKKTACSRIPKTGMEFNGFVGSYLNNLLDQWLLIAPKANPGMLEMLRDRDASPVREMVAWAGEFAGKYLTSAVQFLRLTNDQKLKTWLQEFVGMYIGFQAEDGYLGPWPKKCRLTNTNAGGGGTWDTWGHYHAMLGLLLWHDETRDKQALDCAARIGDLFCRKYLGRKKPRLVETGSTTMNMAPAHSLCILYRKTKNEKYLKLALQLVDEFAVKADGEFLAGDYLNQALAGKEFYQTPKPRWESLHPIMALAELYWITGEEKYKEAYQQVWWSIVKLDRHNNGGFSSGEQATGNPYHLAPIESCCTIAWISLSVEMLKLTGTSVVADELELSLFNSITGMHSSTGRWATYNTPMNGVRCASAHSIVFQAREGTPELNCCSVNTPRGFGMLSDWALQKDDAGLVLNYYGSSTLTAKIKPGLSVTLTQKTEYPLDGTINIKVQPSNKSDFCLKLRIPYWSAQTTVKLNGTSLRGVKAGEYLEISHTWKRGDTISIGMDMSLHFWQGEDECKGQTSVYRGPILLAFDHRYNLGHAAARKLEVREIDQYGSMKSTLKIPPIDAGKMRLKPVQWKEWMPPLLLLECTADNGTKVRLCDFGSAGEAGTPYYSWLPVKHVPKSPGFSRENPLRSSRG